MVITALKQARAAFPVSTNTPPTLRVLCIFVVFNHDEALSAAESLLVPIGVFNSVRNTHAPTLRGPMASSVIQHILHAQAGPCSLETPLG